MVFNLAILMPPSAFAKLGKIYFGPTQPSFLIPNFQRYFDFTYCNPHFLIPGHANFSRFSITEILCRIFTLTQSSWSPATRIFSMKMSLVLNLLLALTCFLLSVI